MPLQNCRWCHQQIRMVRTQRNARMPINVLPDDKGNVMFTDPIHEVVAIVKPGEDDYRVRYMPHFATCEPYKQWLRDKRQKPSVHPNLTLIRGGKR